MRTRLSRVPRWVLPHRPAWRPCFLRQVSPLRLGNTVVGPCTQPKRSFRTATLCEYPSSTIYALSTAPGRAAIAIIRASGPACTQVNHPTYPLSTFELTGRPPRYTAPSVPIGRSQNLVLQAFALSTTPLSRHQVIQSSIPAPWYSTSPVLAL
jgi:hypothetical protein